MKGMAVFLEPSLELQLLTIAKVVHPRSRVMSTKMLG